MVKFNVFHRYSILFILFFCSFSFGGKEYWKEWKISHKLEKKRAKKALEIYLDWPDIPSEKPFTTFQRAFLNEKTQQKFKQELINKKLVELTKKYPIEEVKTRVLRCNNSDVYKRGISLGLKGLQNLVEASDNEEKKEKEAIHDRVNIPSRRKKRKKAFIKTHPILKPFNPLDILSGILKLASSLADVVGELGIPIISDKLKAISSGLNAVDSIVKGEDIGKALGTLALAGANFYTSGAAGEALSVVQTGISIISEKQ